VRFTGDAADYRFDADHDLDVQRLDQLDQAHAYREPWWM
jgi:hypothetical protein